MIPVNEPLLDGNEKKYLIHCIDTGWISSEGPFVTEFEEKFAKKIGRKHGVAVMNGSAALDAAVLSLGLSSGDEVILPTFTIISCAAAVIRSGAKPVFVDVDPSTWNIDTALIEKAITKRTKAIMVVHIYGLPCDMGPILSIAKKFNLRIIEDAAEAHGQSYMGKNCGTFGEVSVFSFYPNKHITTGEGGMILTDSDDIANYCRSLRNLCFNTDRRFVHDELGFNMRMTNLQAALGLAQLERLDEFIAIKKQMGKKYTELLSGINEIALPLSKTKYAENIYWVYGIVSKKPGLDARLAMTKLAELGIGTRPFFWPMHNQPILKKMGLVSNAHFPVADQISEFGFYIPSGLAINSSQIEKVSDAVKRVFA
jgi:perosamine synthetase